MKKLGWQKKMLSNIEEVPPKKRYRLVFLAGGLFGMVLRRAVHKPCCRHISKMHMKEIMLIEKLKVGSCSVGGPLGYHSVVQP